MDKREDIIGKVKDYQTLVRNSDFPMPIEAVYLFGSQCRNLPAPPADTFSSLRKRNALLTQCITIFIYGEHEWAKLIYENCYRH